MSAYPVSSKGIGCNVMWQTFTIIWRLGGKGEKRGKEKVIKKESYKVWWYRAEKMSLILLSMFLEFITCEGLIVLSRRFNILAMA